VRVRFICVGSIRRSYLSPGVDDYIKRIRRYTGVEVVEVGAGASGCAGRGSRKMPVENLLEREAGRILRRLDPRDYSIALCDDGREFTSAGLARWLDSLMTGGRVKGAAFIVGGAFGLHPSVVEAADMTISLSKMTLPHELAFLVLVEQVYRALSVIRGEPYSH